MRTPLLALLGVVLGVCLVALTAASPAQAQASVSFTAHGIGSNNLFFDVSNPADPVFVFFSFAPFSAKGNPATTDYFLSYNIGDFNGTFADQGMGVIPLSTMNITGMLDKGTAVAKLNVNTCDVAGFTTISGNCGSFAITVTELPLTFLNESTRGTSVSSAGGITTTTHGSSAEFTSQTTGTALGFAAPAGSSQFPGLVQFNGVTITFTHP
jgi:hypothetical protein